MEKRRKVQLWILGSVVGIAIGVVGTAWVCQMAVAVLVEELTQELMDTEIPVDRSQGYYNKSEESPDFFGPRTGIVLPDGTKPVYMIHSEGLFPPYRLEAQVIIPSSESKPFLQANGFEEASEDFRDLSFLQLTDDLPPAVRPARPGGKMFIRSGGDSATIPMWWTYVMDGSTGDLWIQYNTE